MEFDKKMHNTITKKKDDRTLSAMLRASFVVGLTEVAIVTTQVIIYSIKPVRCGVYEPRQCDESEHVNIALDHRASVICLHPLQDNIPTISNAPTSGHSMRSVHSVRVLCSQRLCYHQC